MIKSNQHNYGPTEPIAWCDILLNQSGIKTTSYRNTEGIHVIINMMIRNYCIPSRACFI